MMITIIFTGPACSLSAPVGAAIHIDCDIVNYVTYCGTINNKYQYSVVTKLFGVRELLRAVIQSVSNQQAHQSDNRMRALFREY